LFAKVSLNFGIVGQYHKAQTYNTKAR
jgi:hypothetical protein